MEPTFQFWQFVASGETFAVRLDHGELTGICGPLHPDEVHDENLSAFDYDDQRDDVAWAQEHAPDGWRVVEPSTLEQPSATA